MGHHEARGGPRGPRVVRLIRLPRLLCLVRLVRLVHLVRLVRLVHLGSRRAGSSRPYASEVDHRRGWLRRATEQPCHGFVRHACSFEVPSFERRVQVARQVRHHARSTLLTIRPGIVHGTSFRAVRRRRLHVRLGLDMRKTRRNKRFETPFRGFDSRRLHNDSG